MQRGKMLQKLDEIERRVYDIVQSNQGGADKQQQLINLTNELGLPHHSADVHSRVLSYAELFKQIEQWISRKRTEHLTKRIVTAAWVSAIMAVITVFALVWIHQNTRQLLIPTERPVLAITESKHTISKKDGEFDILSVNIKFENIGKNPARDLKTVIWFAPHTRPIESGYVNVNQKIFANVVYPGTNFPWLCEISLNRPTPGTSWNNDFLFCIGLTYADDYTNKRYPSEYLYYVYDGKNDIITHADIGERDIMNSRLKPGMEKWLVE